MLQLPSGPDGDCYRIVSIDPGTDTLGASHLTVDLKRRAVILEESHTFDGSRLAKRYAHVTEVHGDRRARLEAHADNLHRYLEYVKPHAVVSESPFMGRFAAAFRALTECMVFISDAVGRYDPMMLLHVVDPPTAKMAVGLVIKKGMTKDDVKKAVLALKDLENPNGIILEDLDEHSIDSIAVGYYLAKRILANL